MFLATIPVMTGYPVLGFGFGMILKDTSFTSLGGFLPALISCLVVGGLHIWKRNTLLSIPAGTVCYMVLVQGVFG